MKTHLFKSVAILGLTLVTSAFMGCGQSDNGGGGGTAVTVNQAGYTNYIGSCSNCTGINMGSPLLNTVTSQTSDGSAELSLQLFGNVSAGCMQPANKLVICASGASVLGGTLRVTNSNYFCGLPQGDYALRPISASQIYMTTLTGGQYEAVGPAGSVIRLSLMQGILYNQNGLDLNSTQNRISISASMQVGSGAGCGMLYTY